MYQCCQNLSNVWQYVGQKPRDNLASVCSFFSTILSHENVEFEFWISKESECCRPRKCSKMSIHCFLLTRIRIDTDENEPSKVCYNGIASLNYSSWVLSSQPSCCWTANMCKTSGTATTCRQKRRLHRSYCSACVELWFVSHPFFSNMLVLESVLGDLGTVSWSAVEFCGTDSS